MEKIELQVNHNLLDPSFDGYKVELNNGMVVNTKRLDESGATANRSNSMVTLQHMRIFANENQLFVDFLRSNDKEKHLYRVLESGNIQKMVFNQERNTWNFQNVAQIQVGQKSEPSYPINMIFVSENLVVVSNGISDIYVFMILNDVEWLEVLNYKISDCVGVFLADARIIEQKLNIVAHRVEENRTRIYWLQIGLENIDVSELTVDGRKEFQQLGHFEACNIDDYGNIVVLANRKPILEGRAPEFDKSQLTRSWEQHEHEIRVIFDLKGQHALISQEDIKLNVSRKSIFLSVHEQILVEGTLNADIDENTVEIQKDEINHKLIVKFLAIDPKRWEKLMEYDDDLEHVAHKGFGAKKVDEDDEEKICGFDEGSEECDVVEGNLFFYWVDWNVAKVFRMCNASGSQVLFKTAAHPLPTLFCLRHDVDGIVWSLENNKLNHLATLKAFGYVQASKNMRIWSGCSPNFKYAGIVESNNKILLYAQSVAIGGELTNRKCSSKVTHLSKQYLITLEPYDNQQIRAVQLLNDIIFVATDRAIHWVHIE